MTKEETELINIITLLKSELNDMIIDCKYNLKDSAVIEVNRIINDMIAEYLKLTKAAG